MEPSTGVGGRFVACRSCCHARHRSLRIEGRIDRSTRSDRRKDRRKDRSIDSFGSIEGSKEGSKDRWKTRSIDRSVFLCLFCSFPPQVVSGHVYARSVRRRAYVFALPYTNTYIWRDDPYTR
jgi:hypothetical protein